MGIGAQMLAYPSSIFQLKFKVTLIASNGKITHYVSLTWFDFKGYFNLIKILYVKSGAAKSAKGQKSKQSLHILNAQTVLKLLNVRAIKYG